MPPRTPPRPGSRGAAAARAAVSRPGRPRPNDRRATLALVNKRKDAVATTSDRQQTAVKHTATNVEPKGPLTEEGVGNLDKVRDILFGGQIRDYDRRFSRIEERLVKETADLKDEVRQRLAALEQYVKNETATLSERIKTEHDERSDATKDLARELRDASKAFEKKTGQLDDQIARVQREARQQILELQQHLTDDLRQKIDEVLARLTQEATELRADKTDRATLAALLTEMAMRLNNELTLPVGED